VSEPNRFSTSGKTFLPEIKKGLEDEFYASLQRHFLRRLRENEGPAERDVWCSMTKAQERQYKSFAKDAEARIGREVVMTEGVLSEYTRLRQVAIAPILSADPIRFNWKKSGEIDRLIDSLAERGIVADDPDGDEKVVVASQWTSVLAAVAERLDVEGIEHVSITGLLSAEEREANRLAFQADDGPRVILVSTTAGGIGIDLDRADSVHIMDETWDPDDIEQVRFRIDRRGRTRTEKMEILYYRTIGTIDEYVAGTNLRKAETNEALLDLRRAAFKAIHGEGS